MRVVAWNLGHQTFNRPVKDAFISAVKQLAPHILILNEYVHDKYAAEFIDALESLGLREHCVSKRATASRSNQVLIASRHPLLPGDLTFPPIDDGHAETNFLHVKVPDLDIEVVGLRVPWYEDEVVLRRYWEELVPLISSVADRRILFAGDFNADPNHDWHLGGKYLVHLKADEWTIPDPEGKWSFKSGSKLDHAIVSSSLTVRSAAYVTTLDGELICGGRKDFVSDHAALSFEVDLVERPIETVRELELSEHSADPADPPPFANRGSQRWLQVVVNRDPEVLNAAIRATLELPSMARIEWLSPLESERYLEYQDQPAMDRLGVRLDKRALRDFWPAAGPRWDGLARTSTGDLLLIEAKAHVPEMISGGCKAGERSIARIRESMTHVQQELSIATSLDWCGPFYQYANRLAHLHFLRAQNDVKAHLVYVYFLNAPRVKTPSSKEEFVGATKLIDACLGFGRHALRRYVHKVFIDVNDLLVHVPDASADSLQLPAAAPSEIT